MEFRIAAAAVVCGLVAAAPGCAFLLDSDTLASDAGAEGGTGVSNEAGVDGDATVGMEGSVAADSGAEADATAIDTGGTPDVATSDVGAGVVDAGCSKGDAGPPLQAAQNGVCTLVYSSSANGWDIGVDDAGSHDWYTTPFFGGPITPASFWSVSDAGVLTLGCGDCDAGAAIQSAAAAQSQHAWQQGYFEATLRFDPSMPVGSNGWPGWWSQALEHTNGKSVIDAATGYEDFAGVDFFQAEGRGAPYDANGYYPALHEFYGAFNQTCDPGQNTYCQATAPDAEVPLAPAGGWSTFHKYGCLWLPGSVTWYVDDVQTAQQKWSTAEPFSILDQDRLYVMLSTGKGWPVEVQSVRVWQR